jgi:hypothetical protein
MKPRKHAELIKAWADGATIEFNSIDGWTKMSYPRFYESMEYRIKTREFENNAYYPVIDEFGEQQVMRYSSNYRRFFITGDLHAYKEESLQVIGDKLDITFPEL